MDFCVLKFIRKQMALCLVKHIKKQIGARKRTKELQVNNKETLKLESIDLSNYMGSLGDDTEEGVGLELPLFEFRMISEATNSFDRENKLGEGGYGPVYKGRLLGGREIAVKRLSKMSGQGMAEFKNEVVLISKLQHRNLVRLLGCCIDAEEKLLIYEFMPNKSLDAFLFDATKRGLLDWPRRSNIIDGVARGLLYLHRDSRLRIIHRDLKASNILLDQEFNAKISDFGMARIFHGNQILATTNKVVGTLGYMSPEYVMEGRFSEKSDVFSFGVLLLEILSGTRNNYYHDDDENYINLLGYAWTLWSESRAIELIDPSLGDSFSSSEATRFIQVGLLCVQEYPADRPTVSSVVSMLSSDMSPPTPKRSAFFGRSLVDDGNGVFSLNEVTITGLQCR